MIGNVFILSVAACSVIYAGLCLYAYYVSDSMIFPELEASYEDGADLLKLESSTGDRISAYFLEASNTEKVLLYSHGNGEDIGHIRPLMEEFRKRGVSVLAYDYPGYGTSSGSPSESGVYAAAEAAFLYLTNERGYAPESMTLYGRSLGSGPSCWLAERYEVRGLILDGAFSSTFRVMTGIKVLPFDKFDNLNRLGEVGCPVLILHGKRDIVVPFTHALKNEASVKNSVQTLWIDEANHNNLIEIAGEAYWEVVLEFIHR